MTVLSRRGLVIGAAAFIAAPAIVRVTSIMPVKAWANDHLWYLPESPGLSLTAFPHPTTNNIVELGAELNEEALENLLIEIAAIKDEFGRFIILDPWARAGLKMPKPWPKRT